MFRVMIFLSFVAGLYYAGTWNTSPPMGSVAASTVPEISLSAPFIADSAGAAVTLRDWTPSANSQSSILWNASATPLIAAQPGKMGLSRQ